MTPANIPLPTLPLFPVIDGMLIDLLQSLTDDDWHRPTLARLWTVKDIVAHLLDGSLRGLSMARDGYFGEQPPEIESYSDLVGYLNGLNMSWTNATKRLSPRVLVALLEDAGKQYVAYLNTLDPFAPAIFSVAWAGQEVSPNWFHIAREYTERFLHQQQIRDAVGKPGLLISALYRPYLDTLLYGLPHTYRNTPAQLGTVVRVAVGGEAGGEWHICKHETGWALVQSPTEPPRASVTIGPDDAWKLFSKGLSPQAVRPRVTITGDQALGEVALSMVSVMA